MRSGSPRLNRLFRTDGRCVILAFDHGLFGEPDWLAALTDLPEIIQAHAAESPDGMTLAPGAARHLQARMDRHKPALLLRADITNAYLSTRPSRMFALPLNDIVPQALVLDAVAVVAALITDPGQEALTRECIGNLNALRASCALAGMLLMIEVMAMTVNDGVPRVQTDVSIIAPMVRQAMELGADIIKADPTEPAEDFAAVVKAAAGIPVIASGGVKAADDAVLARTAALLQAGARGIAYGRNVMWAHDPVRMTRALIQLVHGGATLADALATALP